MARTRRGFSNAVPGNGIVLAENNGLLTGVIASWQFSTSTSASDPGAGYLRFNHATVASATAVYIDNLDGQGNDLGAWLDTLANGQIAFRSANSPSDFAIFAITGVANSTGYRTLTLTWIAGTPGFVNLETLAIQAYRAVTLGASDTPQFAAINVGHATDTTLSRSAAGKLAVEGVDLIRATDVRERLTADRTYYVRTDGSNSNTGLVNTSGGAFLTIQKAIDTVAGLDLGIYNVTIKLADGSYSGATVSAPWVGAGTVTVEGNTATPANVTVAGVTSTGVGSKITVSGFTLVATIGLSALSGGYIKLGAAMVFGVCTFHMRANGPGSVVDVQSVAYSITGAAAIHYYASPTGAVLAFGATVTITGTPAFASAFALADRLGVISANSVTFSGSATGTRYSASSNAVIHTGGGGASYFPGNASGSTATGGQYT